ncbi:MAG: phosphoribosylaminoimidazolesuccinocarboxamide synthase [Defluviitaleaceae bacterium]|nr:phosphoribosylaminoimidazolesuccinocarboxamide synthase [Defluviitaleaceae bacterium]
MKLSKDNLQKIYEGKTKDVYQYSDDKILLYTKDETTGWWKNDSLGNRYFEEDPGGNEVGPAVAGMGQKNLISSDYYFKKFVEAGIPTHYISCDIDENLMLVKLGKVLGQGLECIIRFYAMGSLLRRFPGEYTEGQPLNDFFETTLKSDADNDPPITKEELVSKEMITESQYDNMRKICHDAATVIQRDLKEANLTLVDIKFEVGITHGEIVLIDEVSAGVMRVAKGDVSTAHILNEDQLAEILVARATSL